MSLILIAIFATIAVTTWGQSLEPGTWKTKASFTLNGLPMPSSQDENCVSAEEAKDAKTSLTRELKKNGCELKKWSVKSSHLEASLVCKNSELNAKGTLKGRFTAKNYELSGSAQGTYKEILPSQATLKLSGQWTGACPEKTSKE